MATFSGSKFPDVSTAVSPSRPTWYLTNGWGARWGENWGGNPDWNINNPLPGSGFLVTDAYPSSAPGSGTYTDNRPIPLRESSFSGSSSGGYADVFYNRIVIDPPAVDFGSVVTDQVQTFRVWNAYFTQQTMDAVTETDFGTGLVFSGQTVPSAFGALEEREYTLTAEKLGPPTIAAALTFGWAAAVPDVDLPISGNRVLLLPVVFKDNMTEALQWSTDILTSWDGQEQRVRRRLAPRQRLNVEAFLTASELRRIENLIYPALTSSWAVPLWFESRTADTTPLAGDTIINVDTRYADFRVGSLAILWAGPQTNDVVQIDAKTDSTLTLSSQLPNSYSSPPIVMPIRTARIVGQPQRIFSGFDGGLQVSLEVTDNIVLPTSPSASQFLSEDTWEEEPLKIGDQGAEDSYFQDITTQDEGTGVVQLNTPWDFTQIARRFDLLFEGQQAAWEFREWLHRRSGRLVPFYSPSFEPNFILTSSGTITTVLNVENDGYDLDRIGRDHIVFRLTDGTFKYRTITNSEILPGDTEVQLTITPALNKTTAEIDEISFAGLKRLTADTASLTWLQNNVLSVTLSVTEIEP